MIPSKLFWHFARGYFDGDGSVGSYLKQDCRYSQLQICFVSRSWWFLAGLHYRLWRRIDEFREVKVAKKTHEPLMYVWQTGDQKAIRMFFRLLYRDATVCLETKRDIVMKQMCESLLIDLEALGINSQRANECFEQLATGRQGASREKSQAA